MSTKLIGALGALALLLLASASAQNSVKTPLFGFHTELVEANTATPISVNVTRTRGGIHSQTIGQTFGQYNESGLQEGNAEEREADIVWVKEGGRWLQFYFNNGWKAVGYRNADMSGYAIPHDRGFFIESRAENDWLIAFGGYVRQDPMIYYVAQGFNILNRGFPLPIPLHKSGIEISQGFGPDDIVWLYDEGGIYNRYYFDGLMWKKVGSNGDYGEVVIPSTLVIQTMGKGGRVVLYPPQGLQKSKTLPNKTLVPPPPTPQVGMAFTQNERGWGTTELFQISWNAWGPKVLYRTEVFEENWFEISAKSGHSQQTLFDEAIMVTAAGRIRLRWGIARVRAEWAGKTD